MINLYDLQGNQLDLEGYKGLKLHIPSPSFDYETEKIEGRNGEVLIDGTKSLQPRQLTADFYMKSKDYTDSLLLRDVIYRQINGREFYIAESHLPNKRWKVHLSDRYEMERLAPIMQTFSVPLVCMGGLAESAGTTQDELTFTSDVWQFGQGLFWSDDGEISYSHNTRFFSIYNAGDVTLDPRNYPMVISYYGPSNNLEIHNETTGDKWKYTGSSSVGEMITLDGVRSLKDGVSIFGNTNKKLITLAPGWNDFELSGTSGEFIISFNHKFYYY